MFFSGFLSFFLSFFPANSNALQTHGLEIYNNIYFKNPSFLLQNLLVEEWNISASQPWQMFSCKLNYFISA